MPATIVFVLVLGSLCASVGTALLKVGATGRTTIIEFLNVWIVGGLILYGLGSVFWIYGMSKESLISVYPFTVLSFVFVYGIGIFVIGETPTRAGMFGVALIIIGLLFIARNPG